MTAIDSKDDSFMITVVYYKSTYKIHVTPLITLYELQQTIRHIFNISLDYNISISKSDVILEDIRKTLRDYKIKPNDAFEVIEYYPDYGPLE